MTINQPGSSFGANELSPLEANQLHQPRSMFVDTHQAANPSPPIQTYTKATSAAVGAGGGGGGDDDDNDDDDDPSPTPTPINRGVNGGNEIGRAHV